MKTLIIDNIDSFTFNLVQYVGVLGGNPVVVDNRISESELERSIRDATHIIISPGPGKPKDAGISNVVLERYSKDIPTLGVCLGHQCIAHVFGGVVSHAKHQMHGKVSAIGHTGGGIFKGIPNPFQATRYHSLAVSDVNLPTELLVDARTLDEDREIMALSHALHPIFGVQFHPESIMTQEGMAIVKNFLEVVL
jgi:anthranilate synthase/aminodeoxychorismate synthase-like glutamine amidotransferase